MRKGEMEEIICQNMIKFQKEQLGRGAESARAYIIGDMVVIRLGGVLTSAEKHLATKDKGKALIKELRYQLEEIIRPELEALMMKITGTNVISLHNDISTKTGERIDVIILEKAIVFSEEDGLREE